MNTSIITFQDKYKKLLDDLDDKITNRRNEFEKETNQKFDKTDKDNAHLDREVEREKADRLKENEENLKKLNAAIQKVEDCVKAEVDNRTNSDIKIEQKISSTNQHLNDTLDNARAERERER